MHRTQFGTIGHFFSLTILAVASAHCVPTVSIGDAGQLASGVDAGVTDGGTTDGGVADAGPQFTQTDLVSDGTVGGTTADTTLINPWGMAASPNGPFWIAENGTGNSVVYDGTGKSQTLTVTIPPPGAAGPGVTAAPSGVVFNDAATSGVFMSDTFIFVTEDGTISGWQTGGAATLRMDNSKSGAVYKGVAVSTAMPAKIFVANFNSGMIDTFDTNYAAAGSFTDTNIPTGLAPFNVANLAGQLVVTYAKQNGAKHDDVAGAGNGYVDIFNFNGQLVTRLVSNGALNSPWGLTIAPIGFSALTGSLLVGNFGDGTIHAYDMQSGVLRAQFMTTSGTPLTIMDLWSIQFGNGAGSGSATSLYFTAGLQSEMHGLFGHIDPAP